MNPDAVQGKIRTAWLAVKRVGVPARSLVRHDRGGPRRPCAPNSVDAALIERYCAYTLDDHGTVNRIEIHHRAWGLRAVEAEFELNTMTNQVGTCSRASPSCTSPPGRMS